MKNKIIKDKLLNILDEEKIILGLKNNNGSIMLISKNNNGDYTCNIVR